MTPYEEIIDKIRQNLYSSLGPELCQVVEMAVLDALGDFDLSRKSTALVVYDDSDVQLLSRFCLAKGVQGLSKKSLDLYAKNIGKFLQASGKHIKEVAPDDVRVYLAKKKIGGASDNYLANILRSLSSFYSWLEKEDLIEKNPVTRVEPIKIHKKVRNALTDDQMEAVRHAVTTKRDKALVEFLYSTGCRVSEACSVKIQDINFDTLELIVTGKGNKQRTVYLSQRAKYLLQDYLSSRDDHYPWLFTRSYESLPEKVAETFKKGHELNPNTITPEGALNKSSVEQVLRKVSRKLGFRVHPHLIRKTMATAALRKGMPIERIRVLLGHDSIATTTIYAQTSQNEVKLDHEKYV